MSALTCYSPEEIRQAVQTIADDLKSRRVSYEETVTRLEPLMFRDTAGKWWALGVRSLRWYRHADKAWEAARTPPHLLEGLAGAIIQKPCETPEPTPLDESRHLKPTQALQALLHDLRQRYEQGLINSDSVHELVSSQYLVDRSGQVWTLGFQTRGWFYYANRGWQPSDDPPDPQKLLSRDKSLGFCLECSQSYPQEAAYCPRCGGLLQRGLDLGEAAAQNLLEFLQDGAHTLPEPIVRLWLPPEGLPEDPRPQPGDCACGYPIPPDARFCPACGAERPVLPPENCGGCAKQLLPEARFCAYCGQPVAKGTLG